MDLDLQFDTPGSAQKNASIKGRRLVRDGEVPVTNVPRHY